jgi:hypothetical protein
MANGIVQGGTYTQEHKGEQLNPKDWTSVMPAVVESLVIDQYVSLTNTDTIATSDTVALCTRALKVLTANKIAVSGNMSRTLDIVTCATPGAAANIKVGDKIWINTSTDAGNVIEKIDDTYLRVDASGSIGGAAATWQRPMFTNVFPGATIVLETGVLTSLVVESKTSNFEVVTTTSGTITSKDLVTYKNIESLLSYKEDDSKGEIYGVAMEAFTKTGTTYDADQTTPIKVKWMGEYDKTKTTTVDHATAGTVPELIHRKAVRLYHVSHTRRF